MNAVGFAGKRQIRPVVDEKEYSGLSRENAQTFCDSKQLRKRSAFVAQLNHSRAACYARARDAFVRSLGIIEFFGDKVQSVQVRT